MSGWENVIFTEDANVDFLDDLANLDDDGGVEEVVEAISDAIKVAQSDGHVTEVDTQNGLAAATIAAIWAGAPYSAGEIVSNYPFIRSYVGHGSEELYEAAAELLEDADTQEDLEVYIEALS
ncbi:DUF4259 domain-containing protein [Corynebacterium sp. ZY180755]